MSYDQSKIGQPWKGYYITAYGIAVKHGFRGTEEEWLESLAGVPGKSVEMRFDEEAGIVQWRKEGDETWTDLLDIEELQTEIVTETIAQAEAAKMAAEIAQKAAETAKEGSETAAGTATAKAQEAEQSAAQAARESGDAASAAQSAEEVSVAAETAANTAVAKAQEAAQSADQAAAEEERAEEKAILAESWAVGGTGTRAGEDTNNAKYWSENAQAAAGGGVTTFNGRYGAVVPQTGDYKAGMVGADPEGTADEAVSTHNQARDAHQALFGEKANTADLETHVGDKGNPHEVTAQQVMTEDGDSVEAALAGRADLTLSNLTNPQQALANLGAGVRPNLADNCDFTNPVNTVGFTSGTYSNDFSIFNRWNVQSLGNSITATLTATGLQVNTTASNQGIRQAIDAKNFSAQLYTSSVIIDGVLYSAQFPKPTGSGVIIQYPGSNYYFAITPYGDAWFWYPFVEYQAEPMEVTISHCKLEEGEGQTLAYEDESGSLVVLPHPDSSYAVQLLRCQMYGTSSIVGGIGASPRPNGALNPLALINQKGQSSYSNNTGSSKYAFDGRKGRLFNVALADGVESISITGIQEGAARYGAVVPSGIKSGKTYTASVCIKATSVTGNPYFMCSNKSTIVAGSAPINITQSQDYIVLSTTFTASADGTSVLLELVAGSNGSALSADVCGWKIEEGPNQTLAYQDADDAWHMLPQAESDYATQLGKCQRFLYVLKGQSWIGSGVMDNNTQGQFFIPLPVTMRTVPTISGTVRIYNQLNNVEATEISAFDFSSNGVHGFFKIGSGSTLSSGDTVFLWLYTDEQLIISAEL